MNLMPVAVSLLASIGVVLLPAEVAAQLPFERTEQREPCDHHDPLRQPLFGDLHIHTSYSFDSYISSQRNDPPAAYRYAQGEPITLEAFARLISAVVQ